MPRRDCWCERLATVAVLVWLDLVALLGAVVCEVALAAVLVGRDHEVD